MNVTELTGTFAKSLEALRDDIKQQEQRHLAALAQKLAVEEELQKTQLRLAALQADVDKMCTLFEKVIYKNVAAQAMGARMIMTMRLALTRSRP